MRIAFKEWSAVVSALVDGRQSIILRKGGIAETGGVFRPDHDRFLLYPTYLHQQPDSIQETERFRLAESAADRPTAGIVRFRAWASVDDVRYVNDLSTLHRLQPLHIWSASTVESRFHYRTPGLYVLAVRVHRLDPPIEMIELPRFEGCKTWVELPDPVGLPRPETPVLADSAYAEYRLRLDRLSGAER